MNPTAREILRDLHAEVTPSRPTDAKKNGFQLSSELKNLLDLRTARIEAIKELQRLRKSHVFVLWSWESLDFEDFYTLIDMLEDEEPKCDLDLIVFSFGGSGEAGFRIGHTFHEWAAKQKLRFRVIIPLYAMSAATIITLGADEVVMGLSSQIGPIDPQIPMSDRFGRTRYVPALALFDGLKLVSEYIEKIDNMQSILEEIIRKEHLSLVDLGLKERMRESGKQYAEILLTGGMIPDQTKARACADILTDYFKYHGHPIDGYEAESRLGLKLSHSSGAEWKAIKEIRDSYVEFVNQPGLLSGAIICSAIETALSRKWRYAPLQDSGGSTRMTGNTPFELLRPDRVVPPATERDGPGLRHTGVPPAVATEHKRLPRSEF
jgi:hypothetical protein